MGARESYAAMLTRRYARFGADATFTSPATKQPATLRVIDLSKTKMAGSDFTQVPTIFPTVTARADDIIALGFDPADLVGTAITYNGEEWVVVTYQRHPGVFDPALDQFYFTLEAPTQ